MSDLNPVATSALPHQILDVDKQVTSMYERGWAILPRFLSEAQLHAAREALSAHRRGDRGRSRLEGFGTERIHTLVACGKIFEDISEHPLMMALCDRVLSPGYLLSISQAICIHPGEAAQPIHYDDSFYRIPRPRPAVSISTIVAMDDFHSTNGPTEVVPGSHLWDHKKVSECCDALGNEASEFSSVHEPIQVHMAAGDCLVYFGTLLHRGGNNRSSAPRLALTSQYCEPWARTQENFFLAVPRTHVRRMSPRLQELLGYSIHKPNMGHVSALHPKKTLEDNYVGRFERPGYCGLLPDYWVDESDPRREHA